MGGMWVRPFDFRQHTGDDDLPAAIEFGRKRVVGQCGYGQQENAEHSANPARDLRMRHSFALEPGSDLASISTAQASTLQNRVNRVYGVWVSRTRVAVIAIKWRLQERLAPRFRGKEERHAEEDHRLQKQVPIGRQNKRYLIPMHITRRSLLVAASLGFRAKAAEPPSPLMATVSEYMSQAGTHPLPDAVMEKAKQMILDTFGAMISGSQLPPGRFAIDFARANGGNAVCTVAGSNVVCGPIEAALANGMLAHSDETDDTHPPSQSHPGCSIVPAALATGEKFGIDGMHFIRAVVLGYDIGPRVTATLGKLQYMVDTHRSTHAISATFGSAAAAGCAANLNAHQMRWLMSWAAQQASGLASWQRDTDHIEKSFDFGGMGARNGVTSALIVQAGGTGVDDVFSGPDNFFQAFGPANDPKMLIDKLGERYEISRTNVKKWTVGSPIQAPLDALENLLKKYGFGAEQVQEVRVRVATDEATIVDNREIPDICLQHMVAVMLVDKTASFKSAHDLARMKDPAVLRQRAKVRLIKDADLEKLMPRREAVVEVTLTDGKTVSERVGNVRGTAENPMTREEVITKTRDLVTPVIGASKCQSLIDRVFALEKVSNVLQLRPLLQTN
jgi:2-methylcitrate dehydratase PrpD